MQRVLIIDMSTVLVLPPSKSMVLYLRKTFNSCVLVPNQTGWRGNLVLRLPARQRRAAVLVRI
jgi:hypothetical protein